MAGEGGTKGKSLLAAFDLLVGVTGLSLDIVGLAGPDPLDSKIDALAAEIAQIDAKLDVLQATIDGLGQDILAEFDALTKRDLATARAKVETVWDELSDFQRKENPTEADKEKVSDLADAALNEMMAQFTQIDGVIPDDMAAIMVDAVNYAITMRLKVANVVEDGAIGKASIKDGLLDAAAALERIESGFFATLPGFVKTTISTTYTELGHLKTRVWDGADLAGLNLHFALERGSIIPGLAIWSDTYTVVSVSEITGAERTELYTYITGGPFNANMTGILATRDTAIANVVAQDKAILTELSDTAVDYRSLADGDDIVGTSGDDTRVGTAGNDLITGLGGDDMLSGAGDADVIRGGSGHDRLKGGGGRDFLVGGTGRDNMSGGTGADTLMGARGNDILSGDLGNDHMAGGAGQDTLRGKDGRDALGGGAGRDLLEGGKGADLLLGGKDNDTLLGGTGADRLEGGRGDDILTGGPGADLFVFAPGTGSDRITDFDKDDDQLIFEGVRRVDLTVERTGGDTLLHFGTDTVVLEGVTLTKPDLDMVFV